MSIEQHSDPGRLKEQNRVLWRLAIAQRTPTADFLDSLRETISVAAHFLGVQKVSVWEFVNLRSELECTLIYDRLAQTFDSGQILHAADYPAYFSACSNARLINVRDVSTDPRTADLLQGYLVPCAITAILDVPLFSGAHQCGIVCFEHSGGVRDWTEEDCAFATAIADLVGLAIAARASQEARFFIESGLGAIPQAVLVCRADGGIERSNHRTSEIFGYSDSDLTKISIDALLPGTLDAHSGVIAAAFAPSPSEHVYATHSQFGVHRSGRRFPIEFSVTHLPHRRGPQALVVLTDVSERYHKALQLQRSEALYRSVVEDQTDLIIRVTTEHEISFFNSAVARLTGMTHDELLHKSIYDFVPEEEHRIIREAIARLVPEQPVVSYQHHLIVPGKPLLTYAWTVRGFYEQSDKLRGYQAIGHDVTQELEKQERLRDAQRFESLAILAGGMAHDFNNLLTPILSFTDLAQTSLPAESEARELLSFVMEAAVRARDLSQLVLVFSKKGDARARHPVYAGHFIREILTFLRATASSRVRFSENVNLDCGVINASPTDLYQILSNLCTNAIQAMPAGGDLLVTASKVWRAEGEMLQLEVADTGAGILPELMSRIFDPFFTTKPSGEGTGLGLPVVKSIIEELGGSIACQSAAGKGTSFVVYLPVLEMPPGADMEGVPPAVLRGSEHVLVVDDENFVVLTLRNGLERLGYIVTARTSANEALVTFRENPARFDAVVTDFTMPFMTGVELAWQLHLERPDLPVVLVSGYGQLLTMEEIARAGVDACVNKPFVTEEVATALRQAFNKRK